MFLKTAIVLAVLAVAANAAELSMEQGTVAPGKPAALSLKLAPDRTLPLAFNSIWNMTPRRWM